MLELNYCDGHPYPKEIVPVLDDNTWHLWRDESDAQLSLFPTVGVAEWSLPLPDRWRLHEHWLLSDEFQPICKECKYHF